jgi:arylsulfatase A-like enzyme
MNSLRQSVAKLACFAVLISVYGMLPVATAADSKPNVLLILVDDLGFGDLSVQGAKDLQTPNLDALAASGIRFNNFYANCTVCSPTRAALMTGRYPDLVGVPGVIRTHADNNWGYLQPNGPTLPEQMKKAGYRTGMVGKWHLGLKSPNTPNDRGFDFFKGFLGDMMDDYYNHLRHGNNYMRENRKEINPEGHATDLFSDWAVRFIKEEKPTRKPWFLYLAYNAPHTPIQPPDEWLELIKLREPGITDKRAKLVALIEHLDHGIGLVLDTLRESGQADNTLILFTSDNGGQISAGAFNGPYRGGKQDMYEGGLRVPFFAAWPSHIVPESTSDEIALTMDLYATVTEVAGAEVKHEIDGRSILHVLDGKAETMGERPFVWMRREGGIRYGGQCYYGYRDGPWKLMQNTPYSPLELFNLEKDSAELSNVIEQNGEVARRLSQQLSQHIQQAGKLPWQK